MTPPAADTGCLFPAHPQLGDAVRVRHRQRHSVAPRWGGPSVFRHPHCPRL